MSESLKLMAVLAHPDDESLGFGGALAKYSAEGVETYVVTATRGERGRFGSAGKTADPGLVGRVREEELRAAAAMLGVGEVSVLGYPDGGVDRVNAPHAIGEIVHHIRRIRPQVVLTFGPEGGYGHPDHIAISQFTTAALVCAGDSGFEAVNGWKPAAPHRVAKLYYMAWRHDKWSAYQAALKKLTSKVDGVERQATPWPDWAVTTEIDTSARWPVVWQAISCHKTQMAIYEQLENLPEDLHRALWGSQEFYRAYSAVNGGRTVETDLFEGLR
jgi:LmbE family N-acetylglucosaminyl deacetylase